MVSKPLKTSSLVMTRPVSVLRRAGERRGTRAGPAAPRGAGGGAGRHEVEPAGAAGAAGGGAELAAALADLGADRVVELGGERARADARGVGLRHAPDDVDVARP